MKKDLRLSVRCIDCAVLSGLFTITITHFPIFFSLFPHFFHQMQQMIVFLPDFLVIVCFSSRKYVNGTLLCLCIQSRDWCQIFDSSTNVAKRKRDRKSDIDEWRNKKKTFRCLCLHIGLQNQLNCHWNCTWILIIIFFFADSTTITFSPWWHSLTFLITFCLLFSIDSLEIASNFQNETNIMNLIN